MFALVGFVSVAVAMIWLPAQVKHTSRAKPIEEVSNLFEEGRRKTFEEEFAQSNVTFEKNGNCLHSVHNGAQAWLTIGGILVGPRYDGEGLVRLPQMESRLYHGTR
jgi:hypothetical protein